MNSTQSSSSNTSANTNGAYKNETYFASNTNIYKDYVNTINTSKHTSTNSSVCTDVLTIVNTMKNNGNNHNNNSSSNSIYKDNDIKEILINTSSSS